MKYDLDGVEDSTNKVKEASTEEKAAGEKLAADREAADKATADREAADKATADREAADKATADREAADKATADREAADKATADREAADKATADREAADKATADREAADKATTDREAADKATADREAADKATADREAADKATTDREAADKATADREAADKATANREAADKATADREAADKATADREAADKATADREAADKATADREAADKATADREAADKATADREAADKATADREAADKATADSVDLQDNSEAINTLSAISLPPGTLVDLLNSAGVPNFRAKYAPFPHDTQQNLRTVHCHELLEDEDRFIIDHIYSENVSDQEFDADYHTVGSFIKWKIDHINHDHTTIGRSKQLPNVATEAENCADRGNEVNEAEVYLMFFNYRAFLAEPQIHQKGEKVRGKSIPSGSEKYLIKEVFTKFAEKIKDFDPDEMIPGNMIVWKRGRTKKRCVESQISKSKDCNENEDNLHSDVLKSKVYIEGDKVNVFWSDLHCATGTIKDGTVDNHVISKITIDEVFQKNIDKLPKCDKQAQLTVGNGISWLYREVEAVTEIREKTKKPRKKDEDRQKASETRRNNKMNVDDEPIKNCECKRLKCDIKISNEEKVKIRRHYWNIDDMEQKNIFLSKLLVQKPKASSSNLQNSKKTRKFTIEYYLPVNGDTDETLRVCESTFKLTLGITAKKVQTVLKKKRDGTTFRHAGIGKKRTKWLQQHRNHVDLVMDHLRKYPIVPSHYRRKYSTKQYFEQNLTVKKMFEHFASENNGVGIELTKFKRILKNFDIKFHKPKNDQCSMCTKYKNSSKEADITGEFMEHITRKDTARAQKNADKQRSKDDPKFLAIIGDLEAVRNIPKAESGDFYYISKISCYNFSIYNLSDSTGTCYMWDQSKGKRGSNEIGSALKHYIANIPEVVEDLVIYMDTCWGQNKNQMVASMLLKEVNCSKTLKKITLKFFESGHNQSEVDSIHSCMERALKRQELFTPDAVKIKVEATTSYKLIDLGSDTSPIYDLHKLNENIIHNRNNYIQSNREGTKTRVAVASWADAVILQVEKGNQIIKLGNDFDIENAVCVDTSEAPVTNRTRTSKKPKVKPTDITKVKYQRLYENDVPVPQNIVDGIMALVRKGQIPSRYHSYYYGLKTVPAIEDNN